MKLTTFLTLATLTFSTILKAEDVVIPVVAKPAALTEGTQTKLSDAQIAELLPWAKNSKIFLVDLMATVQSLPMDQKIERLADGIKQVVLESAPKQSELVMRYALNRALVINEILEKETDALAVGTVDAKARVLQSSIQLALKYYDSDMANISANSALPFATFGIEYFTFLADLNKSIFDASAQYNIQRTALEFLQWDLYRDLNNAAYAPQIVKINSSLKIYPNKQISDVHAINYVRQMKKDTELLGLKDKKVYRAKTEMKSRGLYTSEYSSYYGSSLCFNADRDGNKIGTQSVDISNCQEGYMSENSTYYGTFMCYPADYNGKRLGTQNADIKKCTAGYKAFYSSYYGTNLCYPVNSDGEKLGTATVDIKFCQ